VYICGGAGFLIGALGGVGLWLIQRSRKAAPTDAAGALPRHETVPAKPAKKPIETELERLEAERPLVCKLLGLLTLGIYKFYAVPQGKALVVTALGKYRKACEPGLGCILSLWGLYQHPYKDMPLIACREFATPYENEAVVTNDGITCRLDVMVCYRIVDAGKALFEVDDYERAMANMIRAVLRRECAKQPAQTLRASRDQLAETLRGTLDIDVALWGIRARLVEITEIHVPTPETNGRFDPISGR
jgi:regulator of protease activity HflC (stomatin/prohibitin superfamily)